VREIVLGKGLADQLKVEVGEELVIFLQATDGSLGNDALEVVGIVETGNTAIDRQTSYVTLDEAKFLGAMGDRQLHEVALWIDDPHRAETLADRIGARGIVETGPDSEMVVRPWQELMPEMSQMIEVTSSAYWIYYLFVYFLAIFGIVNTQRMSAFERRREFGVMLAIGVSPGRIFGMILGETVLLCLVGSVLGIVLGGGISYYFQVEGLNMAAFARQGSGDFTFMGVSFSQLLYFQLTWRAILEPTLVMLAVGLVSGLWPAVVASRIDPPRAIAGR
jgi:ABC-type lipoprotein release transport system permease subunit